MTSEHDEKVESFRDSIEQRLEALEQAVIDLKSQLDSQDPPKKKKGDY
jgi:uncharacterized protein YceH (UPF0502 family)